MCANQLVCARFCLNVKFLGATFFEHGKQGASIGHNMVENPSKSRLMEEDCTQGVGYKRLVGELWAGQPRQMHSLHYVVSYRASYKPELPDYCIRQYSRKGQVVLDPFCGRGTTALQAALLGRVSLSCDVNPLAIRMTAAKLSPVGLDEIVLRLNEVDFRRPVDLEGYPEKFSPFYHPDTYRELVNLKRFFRKHSDAVSNFVELVAISRLHGHSSGFFSAYTFPQISIPSAHQLLINQKRGQMPEYRAVAPRIIRKASQALRDGFSSDFFAVSSASICEVADARKLEKIGDNSVDLIVTSPPFLDKVDYLADNWLEFWFCDINPNEFGENLVASSSLKHCKAFVREFLLEFLRVLKPGAHAVIEGGDVVVKGEVVYLDDVIAECVSGLAFNDKIFAVKEVLVNKQQFTKLANCFNVDNNKKGSNTNRLVVLQCLKSVSGCRVVPTMLK